ncbi:hypothetical protein LCGC14_1373940 [marine sediment metagenome]|uniref:Uncharacterized protein n=1 Tax=marine sediment metagenome TaxID=412755 RepID=A0A0F9K4L0_9ZZZZ
MSKYILVRGSLGDGLSFIGPFNTFGDAVEYDTKYKVPYSGVSSVVEAQEPTGSPRYPWKKRNAGPQVP